MDVPHKRIFSYKLFIIIKNFTVNSDENNKGLAKYILTFFFFIKYISNFL